MNAEDVAELYCAAKEFFEAVEKISRSNEMKGVFTMSAIHGAPYRGETWEQQADRLKAALQRMNPS